MSPNPLDDDDLYESVVLGGVRSPGKVTLSGHDRKIGWNIQKGSAQKGASMTRSSEDPIEFTASFYLVKDESQGIDDFAGWPAFLAIVNSTVSGPTPKAFDIYHPDLAEQDIKSVVKGTVMGTVHDGKGGQTRAVKFLEYMPPQKSGGAPSGSKTAPKNDPNQKALDELGRLTVEYENTEWK